ncbi:MAG: transglutaminase-like domain-containing protein [Candidatus Zhuqueibacterota bacterium]
MIQKLLLVVLGCMLNSALFANAPTHQPRRITATFSLQIVTENQSLDRKNDLKYWAFLPQEWSNQKNVKILEMHPKPNKKAAMSDEHGTLAYWDFSKRKEATNLTVQIRFTADLYHDEHAIDPQAVPDGHRFDDRELVAYLSNDSLAFITPEIQEISNEVTRNVSDPFLKVRNIFRWVLLHMEHQFPVMQRGTRTILANALNEQQSVFGGDSAEYTWLFVALCRAAHIPARPVVGFLAKEGWETPHTWAEFYLPAHGWIPSDVFLADSKEMIAEFSNGNDQFYYMGSLDNYHLVFYKGSLMPLQPNCPYSSEPFVSANRIWYAPVGILNFAKFTNVNAFLHVENSAFLTETYINPEFGIEMHLGRIWLLHKVEDLGLYFLKEHFTNEDKTISLTLVGRNLPANQRTISVDQAVDLEIQTLERTDERYHVLSKQNHDINGKTWRHLIATTESQGAKQKEMRAYLVIDGSLYWIIISAPQKIYSKHEKLFGKIVQQLKIEPPNRRTIE